MATFSEMDILTRLFLALTTDSQGNPAFRTVSQGVAADSINDTHIDWGTGANQVSAADMPLADAGNYFATDNVEAALQALAAAAVAGGAPKDSTYIVQVPSGTLTNEQALSVLATGLLKSTTETGVLSIAAQGTDYWAPGGTDVAVADGGTGASDASTARTNLGLAIGTNVQAYDATLLSLAALGTAADKIAYTTGVDTWAEASITAYGRSIIDDSDAGTARSTLGLGTMATQASSGVSISGGTITGITDLTVADGGTGVSTLTGLVKGNGASAFSAAAQGTDYWAPGGTDVAVTDGGTGASTAADARSNLGAAAAGSNADITALTAIAAAEGIKLSPYGASAGNTSEIRFLELAGNGSNYVGFKAPDTIAANKVWILPGADGSAGQFLKTDGALTLSWASVAGAFGSGADGELNVTSGTTNIDLGSAAIVVKNYTSINVSAGATLGATNPAAGGTILILLSQGNVTIAGTVNLSSMGAAGGVGATVTITSAGNGGTSSSVNGTNCTNNLGQLRYGGGGGAFAGPNAGIFVNAGGGGGAASLPTAGTAGSSAGTGGVIGAAGVAGVAITAALSVLAGNLGLTICPGAGGGAGGCGVYKDGGGTGTYTGTAGSGGRGGGGLFIACGGTWTFTGTINLAGAAGTNGSGSTGGGTGKNAYSAGGGGGGAAGTGVAIAVAISTNSGTITVTAGGAGNGAKAYVGTVPDQHNVGNGGAGAAGAFAVFQARP